jgi:hypothetical protein
MNNPQTITPEQLELFIQQAHARYMVALLILLGMVCVMFGSIAMAFGGRKVGFIFLAGYGALMTFIGVGLCYIFGPVVLVASIAGLLREWFIGGHKKSLQVQPVA